MRDLYFSPGIKNLPIFVFQHILKVIEKAPVAVDFAEIELHKCNNNDNMQYIKSGDLNMFDCIVTDHGIDEDIVFVDNTFCIRSEIVH